MSEEIKTTNDDMLLGEALPKALFVWLKTLFYFIVLPYKVWKSSVLRLGKNSEEAIINDNEEFPVYTFNKISMDAIIVVLPVLGIIIGLLNWINSYYGGFALFIGSMAISYFIIPLFSFIKEIITMSLSTINKLDQIIENTKK